LLDFVHVIAKYLDRQHRVQHVHVTDTVAFSITVVPEILYCTARYSSYTNDRYGQAVCKSAYYCVENLLSYSTFLPNVIKVIADVTGR